MKCFAIKKFLPLYISNGDIPFAHRMIEEHLKKCPCCYREFQSYTTTKNMVATLRSSSVSPVGEDFWNNIHARVREHKRKNYPFGPAMNVFAYPFLRGAFMFVLFILMGVAVTLQPMLWEQFFISNNNSTEKQMVLPMRMPKKENNNDIYGPFTNKNKLEYQMDKVYPYLLPDASF